MHAGEIGHELAKFVVSEIEDQPDETARQIVYSRILRALQEHPLWKPPCRWCRLKWWLKQTLVSRLRRW